jgi:hypothetical protein
VTLGVGESALPCQAAACAPTVMTVLGASRVSSLRSPAPASVAGLAGVSSSGTPRVRAVVAPWLMLASSVSPTSTTAGACWNSAWLVEMARSAAEAPVAITVSLCGSAICA